MKPDNQKVDIESLKRQMRQEFDARAKELILEEINLVLLDEEDPERLYLIGDPDDYNPEDPLEDDITENDSDPGSVKPFISVKFRNNNKVFTIPADDKYFGEVLTSGDGTVTVNVAGKIFDDQKGIEAYKIRIKRIA